MYKLICIDMDGTLLNKHHEVSDENKKALKAATELGVHVAISTGRVFASARIYAKMTGIKAPLICSNGSYIREKDKDEVIFKSTLGRECLDKLYDVIKKHKLLAYFDTPDGIVADTKIPEDDSHRIMNTWVRENEQIKFYEVEDFKEAFDKYEQDILKLIVIQTKDSSTIEESKADFEKLSDCMDIVYSWHGCAEIMAKNTSKGKAVRTLAKKLGVKKDEIICIGDSGNDLSMLKEAGLAVVMGNAPEEVKKYGGYITDTNEKSGVAKAIKKFVLDVKDK